MAASTCLDVRAQAVRAISQLAQQGHLVQDVMITDGGFKALADALKHSHQEMFRCAVTGVANLLTARGSNGSLSKAQQQLCAKDGPALAQLLALRAQHLLADRLKVSQDPAAIQILRELARAINNVIAACT